jgi:hypothetical protein
VKSTITSARSEGATSKACSGAALGTATRQLLGGLAADSDEPMPEEMRQQLQATWRRIQAKSTGELFRYVNDAVFGLLPGDIWSLPCTWEPGRNQGTAQISVTRKEDRLEGDLNASQPCDYVGHARCSVSPPLATCLLLHPHAPPGEQNAERRAEQIPPGW